MIHSPLPPDVTEAISPLTDIGFEIANHITDPVHFGDLMISLVHSDVRLLVLRDRGEWFVDVGSTRDLNEWFDSRLVLRMSGSLDVQEIVCDLSLLRAYSEIVARTITKWMPLFADDNYPETKSKLQLIMRGSAAERFGYSGYS